MEVFPQRLEILVARFLVIPVTIIVAVQCFPSRLLCVQAEQEAAMKIPGGKFSGKKTKAAAKTGQAKRQWDIMLSNGVPVEDIPKFRYPRLLHLNYV